MYHQNRAQHRLHTGMRCNRQLAKNSDQHPHYAGKTGTSLESDLDEFMEKLYKRYVPSQTREYIESMAEPDEQTRQRPPRASRSAVPDALGTGKEARE